MRDKEHEVVIQYDPTAKLWEVFEIVDGIAEKTEHFDTAAEAIELKRKLEKIAPDVTLGDFVG